MVAGMRKPVERIGSSRDDQRSFPQDVRREAKA
jgi:phage-related protein